MHIWLAVIWIAARHMLPRRDLSSIARSRIITRFHMVSETHLTNHPNHHNTLLV